MLRKLFDLHSALQIETNFINFAHLYSLFLEHDDKVLKQKSTIQQKKFNNLLQHTKRCMIPRKFFSTPPLCPPIYKHKHMYMYIYVYIWDILVLAILWPLPVAFKT